MTEFELIKHYFASQTRQRSDVVHGIGDDAAMVTVANHQELAITTDTLVNGVHFPKTTTPYDIGYKALAVNLSDLAAMGATPAWVTLALTMPTADETWIQAFCDGFFALAKRFQVQLIGGDLTHGPLSITIQAMGLVPKGMALLRSTAKPGDLIYVTGTLGDAGLALATMQMKIQVSSQTEKIILSRLNQPEPRIALGETLRQLAHAAIDISDGLAADLGHILEASKVGANIHLDQLPLSNEMTQTLDNEKAIAFALSAGDDYELCFTIPAEKRAALEKLTSSLPYRCTCVGEITDNPGLELLDKNGNPYHGKLLGYQHF